jgi:hypothetical protein
MGCVIAAAFLRMALFSNNAIRKLFTVLKRHYLQAKDGGYPYGTFISEQ